MSLFGQKVETKSQRGKRQNIYWISTWSKEANKKISGKKETHLSHFHIWRTFDSVNVLKYFCEIVRRQKTHDKTCQNTTYFSIKSKQNFLKCQNIIFFIVSRVVYDCLRGNSVEIVSINTDLWIHRMIEYRSITALWKNGVVWNKIEN